nr:MAG TPA: hypothetical protein [Caudoviricetes sp.]
MKALPQTNSKKLSNIVISRCFSFLVQLFEKLKIVEKLNN